MKLLFPSIFAMILTACASKPPATQTSIPDGVWFGTMKWTAFDAAGKQEEGGNDLIIATCSGTAQIWTGHDDKYKKLGSQYTVVSRPEMHLIYFLDAAPKQPDWVEMQTYSFLELDSERAVLQWNRAVNNRDVAASEKNRYHCCGCSALTRRCRKKWNGVRSRWKPSCPHRRNI